MGSFFLCLPPPSTVSFFPSPFLFLPIPFAWFFSLLRSLFSCSSSFYSFRFFIYLSFCYVFLSFPFVCPCVLVICGFVFVSLFFSPLPAVFLRGFLLSSVLRSFSARLSPACLPLSPLSPLGPFRSSLLFLLWLRLRVGLLFSFCSGLPPPSFPSLTFHVIASCSCCGSLSLSFSLSHHLDYFPCVGNPAPGFSLRLCLPRHIVFSKLGSGGTQLFVSSFHLPGYMLSFWLCLAGFMLLIPSSGCLSLFLRCLLLAALHRMVLLVSLVTAPPVVLLSLSRFSVSSVRVRFFLRLSCLSLVVVLCSPGSFFTLWV